jgi:hypothetical protein
MSKYLTRLKQQLGDSSFEKAINQPLAQEVGKTSPSIQAF